MPATAEKAKARTPKALQEKKLTLREAAEQWIETTHAIEKLKELQSKAAATLIAHTERTDKRAYFDLVTVERSGGSLVMNQEAVRQELPAERFVEGDLMKRSKRGWTVKKIK